MPIDGIVRAVNLLPPDMRGASKATAELGARPEATGGAGPFVVLGVLAACVAGAAGYVLTTNTISQRQADLDAVTAQQQAIAGQIAQFKPFADFEALAAGRVSTVKDIAESRFNWDQTLRDLARAVPQDVTLKSLEGSVSAAAGGSGAVRGAISAPAITLQGCAPGQSQVARLMARLRNIDGVTRVSLSKSDNTLTESASASGSEFDQRNAAPCGGGTNPDFEVVAFFETDTKATQAADTTSGSVTSGAAPGATPTPTATPGSGSATPTPTASGGNTTTASASQGGVSP
jgi:Tfp pilus assembly protein PilN